MDRGVAQFGRASVSKTAGWGFKSLRPWEIIMSETVIETRMNIKENIIKDNTSYFSQVWAIIGNLNLPTFQQFISDYGKSLITIAISSVLLLSIDFIVSNVAKFLLYGFSR